MDSDHPLVDQTLNPTSITTNISFSATGTFHLELEAHASFPVKILKIEQNQITISDIKDRVYEVVNVPFGFDIGRFEGPQKTVVVREGLGPTRRTRGVWVVTRFIWTAGRLFEDGERLVGW